MTPLSKTDMYTKQILVADDQTGMQYFIKAKLQAIMACDIDTATTSEEVLQAADKKKYDIYSLDLVYDKTHDDVISYIVKLREKQPNTQIWIYSGVKNAYVYRELKKHVNLIIYKSESEQLTQDYIRKASLNINNPNSFLCTPAIEKLLKETSETSTLRLTFEELEVAQWLLKGFESKEIARFMGKKLRSIERYRSSLRDKLGAKNNNDLLRLLHEKELHLLC